jgi:CBS domain-containing protein
MAVALPVWAGQAGTVGDVMSVGVISCAPSTRLRTVARLMAERHIHAVYVFDYGDEADETVELWGLVSDLDVAAAYDVIDDRKAADVAVTPLATVTPADHLSVAAERMAQTGSSHLAVLDPVTSRPIGVVSTLDIVRAL